MAMQAARVETKGNYSHNGKSTQFKKREISDKAVRAGKPRKDATVDAKGANNFESGITPLKSAAPKKTGSELSNPDQKAKAKSARRGRSEVKNLLDPGEILSGSMIGTTEERWRWFSNRLDRAGFEKCGFLISQSDIESPLGHPDSRLYGEVVSPDYLTTVMQNPELQSQSRPYRLLRTTRKPVTFFGDDAFIHATPKEQKLAHSVNAEFGIEAWALFPVHMPEKQRLFGLGWFDLHDQEKARRLWSEESGAFCLAATYFVESISASPEENDEKDGSTLSPRERECLLWAGAGKTTSEIAGILNVADGTVEEYFKRSAKKLGATTRAQACVKAVLSGLIAP